MIVLPVVNGQVAGEIPAGVIRTAIVSDQCFIYLPGDDVPLVPQEPDPDAEARAAFEVEQAAQKEAEYQAWKAREGQPSYKAAAVKIASEKLSLTPLIEAAIDVLINADGDKALLVWWTETDAISRGDAQWQRVEGAVEWPKGVTAADLFDLTATI